MDTESRIRDTLLDVASYYAEHDAKQRELGGGKNVDQATAAIAELVLEARVEEVQAAISHASRDNGGNPLTKEAAYLIDRYYELLAQLTTPTKKEK